MVFRPRARPEPETRVSKPAHDGGIGTRLSEIEAIKQGERVTSRTGERPVTGASKDGSVRAALLTAPLPREPIGIMTRSKLFRFERNQGARNFAAVRMK